MKRIISIEIKRSLCNVFFVIAIVIGILIAVSQVLMVVIPTLNEQLEQINYMKNVYPYSVYNTWIGGEAYTFHPELLNLLFPLLATLPYGCSMYEDFRTGFSDNISVRITWREYKKAKSIAVFVSGGISTVAPFAINLFLTYMVIPAIKPSVSAMMFPIFDTSMFCMVYYKYPFLYCVIFEGIIFLIGGLVAEIAMCTYWLFSNIFIVFIGPFVYWVLEAYLLEFFDKSRYAIRYYVRPEQPVNNLSIHILLLKVIAWLCVFMLLCRLETRKIESI